MSLVDLSWIPGNAVTSVSLVEPVSWWFELTDGTALRADTLWRVVTRERVEVTSADHGHQFGLPAPVDARTSAMLALSNARILHASVIQPAGDLVFQFENDARLE